MKYVYIYVPILFDDSIEFSNGTNISFVSKDSFNNSFLIHMTTHHCFFVDRAPFSATIPATHPFLQLLLLLLPLISMDFVKPLFSWVTSI